MNSENEGNGNEKLLFQRRKLNFPENETVNVDSKNESSAGNSNLFTDETLQMEKLKSTLVQQLDKKLLEIVDALVNEFDYRQPNNHQLSALFSSRTSNIENKIRKPKTPTGEIPNKEYIARRSLLTDLFESPHILTIYHIFIAILIVLLLNTVLYDYVDTGKLGLDFELILWSFADFHTVMAIWMVMKLSTILILYPGFHFWSHNRHKEMFYGFDYLWLAMYVVYLCAFLTIPVQLVIENSLPPASSIVVLMEQIRLMMKVHAFVRSNVSRALTYKPNEENDKNQLACPGFSKFLYFLFVPTLVYRDAYPRTLKVNWKNVFSDFLQVVGCLFYIYFILVRFLVPVFHKFGHEPMTSKNLVLSVFCCMMPGALVLLCTFFAILHSWLNAFAEMLRFADRMFYQDWWTSRSFAGYYRTWNVVVHDWLYTYIYKDVHMLTHGKLSSRYLPKIVVFVVSAFVHEYIITFTFRFFYPILFVMFGGIGMLFAFIKEKGRSQWWNILMWLGLFMGTGLLLSLYSMEWYARRNCQNNSDTMLDLCIPRSWICVPMQHQGPIDI